MINLLIAGILLLSVGAAVSYLIKARKKGVKCIGCPAGGNCSGKKGSHSGCSCGCHNMEKQETVVFGKKRV